MKDDTIAKLKGVIKTTLEQYFQQSGINEILLQLYEASKTPKQQPAEVKKTTKVENILKKNAMAVSNMQTKTPKAGGGRIAAMRQSGLPELMGSYQGDQDESYNPRTPMLNAIQQASQYEEIPVGSVNSRVAMNENVDPLNTGLSVLDSSMPDFLKRGLSKIAIK